jgi:AraC family transcriptional regulator
VLPRNRHQDYHGVSLRCRHVSGLVLAERAYPPGLEIRPHWHEHPFLCAILHGGSSELCGGQVWDCTPRTLFLRPAGLTHSNRIGASGLRFLGIELGPQWSACCDPRSWATRNPVAVDGVFTSLPRRLYHEFGQTDSASGLVIEGLVLQLLSEISRATSSTPESQRPRWLRRAQTILHEHYRRPLRLTDLAGEVGVHPHHLARVFRRTYGCTVGEYVRRLRIDCACQALARPGASLVRIALEAGFADQSQFCRTFKRLVGVTPSHYRREIQPR